MVRKLTKTKDVTSNDSKEQELYAFLNPDQEKKSNESNLDVVLKTLGGNIEKRLKEIGMSRKQLAEKIGISQNSISGYIRGKQLPKFDKLYSISVALETSLSELTGGDIYSLQTKESIEKAKKQAVRDYKIADAKEILDNIGWECYKKENGDWQLFRQKTLTDFLSVITEGAKVKSVNLPDGDETLFALSHMVKQAALQALNSNDAIQTVNKQLDEMLSIAK